MADGEPRIGDAERIDPADLGVEADDLAEGIDDADGEDEQDAAVQERVGEKCFPERLGDDGAQEADQRQEYEHAP